MHEHLLLFIATDEEGLVVGNSHMDTGPGCGIRSALQI